MGSSLRGSRDGGLVTDEVVGRQRIFRLAGPDVAEALEVLSLVAPPLPARGLRESRAAAALKRARTCYDHLAGELGVAVTEALVEREVLAPLDGASGDRRRSGVARRSRHRCRALEHRPRSFARSRWTQRRPHLAGSLGAGVATVFFARGWVRHRPGGGRSP